MENVDVNEIINRLEGAAQQLFDRGVSGTFAIGVVLIGLSVVSLITVVWCVARILKLMERNKDRPLGDSSDEDQAIVLTFVSVITGMLFLVFLINGLDDLLTPELVVFDQLMPFS